MSSTANAMHLPKRFHRLRNQLARQREEARRTSTYLRAPAGTGPGGFLRTRGGFLPKAALAVALLAGLTLVGWLLRRHGTLDAQILVDTVRDYPVGAPLIFVVVYAVSVVFLVPTLPLNLGAGMLWGPWTGTLVALAGSGLGALLAFVIARSALGQPLAERFDRRALAWLQDQFQRQGWKVVAFTRLNPVFPSGPINFLFGLTAIRFSTYCWSTLVFLLPFTLVFALVGHQVGGLILNPAAEKRLFNLALLSGALTLVAVVATVARLRRDLKRGR